MTSNNPKSRLLSVVAVMLLLFTVFNTIVFSGFSKVRADDDIPFTGTGTQADPYLIQSAQDWMTLAKLVNEDGKTFTDIFFEMTKNIDLTETGNWTPIGLAGSNKYFKGVINGCGYYVCGVNCVQKDEAGLFGTFGGYAYNLGIETGNFEGKTAGSIAANCANGGSFVFNCYSRANVNGKDCAGGLVGEFNANIVDSWFAGTVSGSNMGGVVGGNAKFLIKCYSTDVPVCNFNKFTGENDCSYQVVNDESTLLTLYNRFYSHSTSGQKLEDKMKKSEIFAGDGTDKSPFLISTADDLKVFRGLVNSGYPFTGVYFKQTADIDLSDVENWKPIGILTSETSFKGVYDGDGHYVSNIHIEHGGAAGLFGLLGGTVVNLGVRDSYIQGDCVGSIASHGKDKAVNIINCYSINNTLVGNSRAGGIADNFVGDIISCYASGNTLEAPKVAGITSYNCATLWNCVSDGYPCYSANFKGEESRNIDLDEQEMSASNVAKHLNGLSRRVIVREGLENVSLNKWVVENEYCVLGAKSSYKTYFLIWYFAIIFLIVALVLGVAYYLKKKQKTLNINNYSIPVVTGILVGSYLLKAIGLLIGNKNFMKMTYFHDINDAYMDFFNPAIFIRNRISSLSDIYISNSQSTYPPIAQLVLGFMSMFVAPSETSTAKAARSSTFGAVLMTMFWFMMLYIIFNLMKKLGKDVNTNTNVKKIFYISLIASAPMVYMLERGNIIVLALIGTFFFLAYYQSEDIVERLLSYLALAIAVSIKIYPVFLLILAFRKKNFRSGIVATATVGIFNIIPFAFTGGIPGILAYMNNLINSNSLNFTKLASGVSIRGFFNFFSNEFGVRISNIWFIAYIVIIFIALVVVALFIKSDWIAALATMLLLIMIPAQTGIYCLAYLIPVVFFGVLDEYKNQLENTILIICTLPLMSFSFIAAIFDAESEVIYACVSVVLQFIVWVMVALLILEIPERIKKVRKPRVKFVES